MELVRRTSDVVILESKNDSVVADFLQSSQELTAVVKRRSSNQLISEADLKKFAFELQNFHVHDAAKVAEHLKTNFEKGLSNAIAEKRLRENGANIVNPTKELPLIAKFGLSFVSGFAPLLWIATALVFISWEPFGTPPSNIYNLILALVLVVVIVVSSVVTFYQEMQASRILQGFKNLVPATCTVLRGGVLNKVEASQLVVGDVVILSMGAKVPADMRIFHSSGLRVDKSMFTGESEPVKITPSCVGESVSMLEASNMVFMGTSVVEGEGKGMVIATGEHNQLSKIITKASGKDKQTSLQADIDALVKIIGTVAIVCTIVVVLYWAFYLRVYHNSFMSVSSMIANAIGVMVAFVPEGLPLALSMGLTIIAKRLCSVHSVLVKRLGTIETLGSMSFLGSDKTGTLTQNQMTVTKLVSALCISSPLQLIASERVENEAAAMTIMTLAQRIGFLCNQATLQSKPNNANWEQDALSLAQLEAGNEIELASSSIVAIGSNATDRAILTWAAESSDLHAYLHDYVVLCLVPFSSVMKLSAVIVLQKSTNQRFLFVKGAPEYVLKLSSSYVNAQGLVCPLTDTFNQQINEVINTEASSGRRMVALAQYGPFSEDLYPMDYVFSCEPKLNFAIADLLFVGTVAVCDPPKEGVKHAIETIRGAGIIVAMITGDAANTACAIAKEVGIISADIHQPDRLAGYHDKQAMFEPTTTQCAAIVVTGADLDTITSEAWEYVFQHTELVFARTTPEHKLMIVQEAQRRGHRVGITGDGINDAPSLKNADVGIAMQSGADVARDAAAMVLLNNDFTAVVQGIIEGRLIFENLRKVIGYQISCGSWAECLPVFATFFLGIPQPLSSFAMILICCISDVFAGVALMNEPPEHAILSRPPRDIQKTHLLDWKLLLYSYMFFANLASIGAFYNFFVYMAERGDSRAIANPIPADDDGSVSFPVGYRTSQLIGAWNWGANSNALGSDETDALNVASTVFYVTIVIAQMGHLLSIRRKTPYGYDAILQTSIHAELPCYTSSSSMMLMSTTSVWIRLWNEYRYSSIRWPIVMAWIGSICTLIFFLYIPVFQVYCGMAPIPGIYWGYAIGWSVLWFVLSEMRKWIVILYPQSMIAQLDW